MSFLKKISISGKIVLLLGLLVALSAVIAGFAAFNILGLARNERSLVNGDGASLRWAASAQEHMTRSHQLVFQINATDFRTSAALRRRLFDEDNSRNSDLDRLHAVMTHDEEPLYREIRTRSARYSAFAATDISLLQTGGRTRAEALLLSSGVQAFDAADAAFDRMVNKQVSDLDGDASNAARRARQALWMMLLASVLGTAGVGALALAIARRQISEPLTEVTEAMARLAAGDHSEMPTPTDRRDEIGDLARVFTVFRHNAIALLATQKEAEEQRRLVEIERLSGGFFRSAIESSMDSVRVLDLDGRLKFMNRGGLVAFEIDDFAPLAGRLCRSLWPEPAATQIGIGIEAALRGESHRFEGMCRTTRGIEKWWDVFIAPIRDDSGALAAIIATSRDITIAHQLRIEAEARALELDRSAAALRSAFRIAHVGGWEVDFITRQVLFSPEICEMLGQPPLPAMPLTESLIFWSEEDRGRFDEALARVEASGERLIFEGRSAGTGRSWRLFGEPVLDGTRCVALRGAVQDISDWRDVVERERAALQAAEAMSGFLATMSHELRTPLNGVLGIAQVMARNELDAPQRERLAMIEASGAALLSLLNDLLDLSKIESAKVELEDGVIDLDALADGARSVFTALVNNKDVALTVTVDDAARGCWRGDPTRIRQVLHNLISNAVKFTDRGSIEVDLSLAPVGLTFKVRDSGIGIAADKLAAVFEKFVQADASTTRRYGGSGLGLTICRDLVVLMGGEILVDSVEGSGATFTVNLPLVRAEPPSTAPETEPAGVNAPDVGALRVLAAEDNPINQIVLRTLLGEVGLEATIVENGQEALDAWRDRHWDIVLMDIQMPVMDGVTAVRSMREIEQKEGRPRTPVIAVTANAMAHQEVAYRAAGMDSMVAKPINLALLLGAMGAALPSGDDASLMVA